MKNSSVSRYMGNSQSLEEWLLQQDREVYSARSKASPVQGKKTYRLIDLFAGAGGMTLGFSQRFGHPFKSVWANDFNDFCVATYNANFGAHCIAGDIVDLLRDPATVIPEADVVIGGPPCQGFSLLNKNRADDPRKQLWRPYFEVLERSNASVFVMENVQQLLGTAEHNQILEKAKELGFRVASEVLVAADYGVPQTRRRAIIIGSKSLDPSYIFPPRKTHFDPKKLAVQPGLIGGSNDNYFFDAEPWRTVKDAIADLPEPKGIEVRATSGPLNLHFGRNPTELSKKRYRAIPEEGMNRFDLQERAPELTPKCWVRKKTGGTDLFGRLWWDRPAVTIRTEFFKPEKGRYLHPEKHRPITHREAARFQCFPDEFEFKGSKIEIAKQIGNAVPPLLAARIADVVVTILNSKS
ncbi:MAG: DNA cytosine methyltransferase [Wenzhouxiangellaceae bacterium]|nr:DNA cytosine methyltransferase [Wenzhouxiangellaceae bacterium]